MPLCFRMKCDHQQLARYLYALHPLNRRTIYLYISLHTVGSRYLPVLASHLYILATGETR